MGMPVWGRRTRARNRCPRCPRARSPGESPGSASGRSIQAFREARRSQSAASSSATPPIASAPSFEAVAGSRLALDEEYVLGGGGEYVEAGGAGGAE